MSEREHEDDRDFAERAADATEESRRRRGEEDVTIEDDPERGHLLHGPQSEDEPDLRT